MEDQNNQDYNHFIVRLIKLKVFNKLYNQLKIVFEISIKQTNKVDFHIIFPNFVHFGLNIYIF